MFDISKTSWSIFILPIHFRVPITIKPIAVQHIHPIGNTK